MRSPSTPQLCSTAAPSRCCTAAPRAARLASLCRRRGSPCSGWCHRLSRCAIVSCSFMLQLTFERQQLKNGTPRWLHDCRLGGRATACAASTGAASAAAGVNRPRQPASCGSFAECTPDASAINRLTAAHPPTQPSHMQLCWRGVGAGGCAVAHGPGGVQARHRLVRRHRDCGLLPDRQPAAAAEPRHLFHARGGALPRHPAAQRQRHGPEPARRRNQ